MKKKWIITGVIVFSLMLVNVSKTEKINKQIAVNIIDIPIPLNIFLTIPLLLS